MQPGADRIFETSDYVPATHGAFVRSTWAFGAQRDGSRDSRRHLDELLSQRDAQCLVASVRGQPDMLAGWGARARHALIFAYVKPVLRKRGLGTLIIERLGLDAAGPIPLLVWTPSSQAIAAAGASRVFFAQYPLEA